MQIDRRKFIVGLGACATPLVGGMANANPYLLGLVRGLLARNAGQSASSVIARTSTKAIARPLVRNSLNRVTRRRLDDAEAELRANRLTRITSEIGGELVSEFAAQYVNNSIGRPSEIGLIQAMSEDSTGDARGLSFVSSSEDTIGTLILPNLHIMALDSFQMAADEYFEGNLEASLAVSQPFGGTSMRENRLGSNTLVSSVTLYVPAGKVDMFVIVGDDNTVSLSSMFFPRYRSRPYGILTADNSLKVAENGQSITEELSSAEYFFDGRITWHSNSNRLT